jgi:hypothetical protein
LSEKKDDGGVARGAVRLKIIYGFYITVQEQLNITTAMTLKAG